MFLQNKICLLLDSIVPEKKQGYQNDDRNAERQVIQPENEKRGHGPDDQVQLNAGIPPEQRDQPDQGDALASGYNQPGEDLVHAMHQRHAKRHRHERQIDGDDPAVGARVGYGIGQRVTGRGHDDQRGQRIENFEPPANPQRIGRRSELDQPRDWLREHDSSSIARGPAIITKSAAAASAMAPAGGAISSRAPSPAA